LPNVGDTDIIRAFLLGTTYESLIHKLGQKSSQTIKELLNIATSHASGEKAVGAIFDRSHSKASGKMTPAMAVPTALKRRRRVSSCVRTRSSPPSSVRAKRCPPRAP
jgi:hypothetical protein